MKTSTKGTLVLVLTALTFLGLGAYLAPGDRPTFGLIDQSRAGPEIPAVCLDALDRGDRLVEALDFTLDVSIRQGGLTASAFDAIADFDIDRLERTAARVYDLSDEVAERTPEFSNVIPSYETAAERCRAEAR